MFAPTSKHLIGAAALAGVLSTGAFAQLPSPNPPNGGCELKTVPLTTTNFQTALSFNKYNGPAEKPLACIIINWRGRIVADARVESLDNEASNITVTRQANFQLKLAGNNLDTANVSQGDVFGATAFDGAIDFGGTSGKTFTQLDKTGGIQTVTLTSPAALAAFSGAGTINLDFHADGASVATGAGNIVSQFGTQASGDVEVCYKYNDQTVPEPGSLALFAPAVLGALVVARRRRK